MTGFDDDPPPLIVTRSPRRGRHVVAALQRKLCFDGVLIELSLQVATSRPGAASACLARVAASSLRNGDL